MADTPSNFDPFQELPDPAARADAKEDYARKADALNAALYKLAKRLNVFVAWLNALIAWIVTTRTDMATSQDAAAQSVKDAAGQVKLATDQAQASKGSAESAALTLNSVKVVAQAVDAAAGLPLPGPALSVLRIKDATGAKEWAPIVINRVGDAVVAPAAPDSSFILDDARYPQATWPELYAKIGVIGFDSMADSAKLNSAPTVALSNASTLTALAMGKDEVVMAGDQTGRIFDITNPSPADAAKYQHPQNYAVNDIATDGKGNWFACGNSGHFVRSVNNGQSWAAASTPTGTNNYNWNCIVSDGNGICLAISNTGGSPILKSTNNGLSWVNVTYASTGLPAGYPWQLTYDGVGVWYALSTNGQFDIYKSTDSGASWVKMVRPPEAVSVMTNGQYVANSITMSRMAAKGNVLAFVSNSYSNQGSYTYYYCIFVYSYDGGLTWQWINMGNTSNGQGPSGGRVAFGGDNTVVVNDASQVYRIWTIKNFNAGRKSLSVNSYYINGISGNYFAGPVTNGLGSWYLMNGNAFKKVAPLYDPRSLFYVPKFTDAPYPFQTYVKARTLV